MNKSKITEARRLFGASPTAKLLGIGAIIFILLIPAAMIKSIIHERENMNRNAIAEVSDKWSRSQVINGPILTIPYNIEHIFDDKRTISRHNYHMLPKQLNIIGEVSPEHLRRGIYEIVVYSSELNIAGSFDINEINKLTGARDILWSEAFVTLGISDLRGIKNQLTLEWNHSNLPIEPGSKINNIIQSGITISTPLPPSNNKIEIPFNLDLTLNGSENLSFVPVGGITKTQLSSSWTAPSFNGSFLPEYRAIDEQGFKASWQTLELNRNFPQSWTDDQVTTELFNSKFGVDLLLPIDDYQKSIRSVKYAILTLSLTFLVFFLVEIMNNKKIHPFQYTLVGLALCLFYILLVSISEHSNFDMAYLISSIGIIAMIGLYSFSVLGGRRLSIILVFILSALYSFLYVTIQLVDYALVMGSIGLALILGATMYFTRKIDWYNLTEPTSVSNS